jgi:hypothetical protein
MLIILAASICGVIRTGLLNSGDCSANSLLRIGANQGNSVFSSSTASEMGPLGYIPPAEAEANYHAQLLEQPNRAA